VALQGEHPFDGQTFTHAIPKRVVGHAEFARPVGQRHCSPLPSQRRGGVATSDVDGGSQRSFDRPARTESLDQSLWSKAQFRCPFGQGVSLAAPSDGGSVGGPTARLSTPLLCRQSVAFAAEAVPFGVSASVVAVVWMPGGAVGNGRETGDERIASQGVHAVCDGFEVRRVHALPVSAKVVEFQPRRNGAALTLVGEPVGENLSTFGTGSRVEPTVPVFHSRPAPHPTRSEVGSVAQNGAVFIHLAPKSRNRRSGVHNAILAGGYPYGK
jgi:hypothetical protein